MAERAERRDLTQGSLTRTLLRMALPVMAGMVLNSLYSLVTVFWLGKMAEGKKEALAAVGPSVALTFIVVAFGMGFGSGGTALVAQHMGARRPREADRAAGQTILVLSVMTTVLGAVMFLLAPQVLRLLQTPDDVMPQALPYLRIGLLATPFLAFNMAYGSALRAMGDTITMVVVGAVTNVLNFCLLPLLIFGWHWVPAMGIRGAAIISTFSAFLSAVACVMLLRRGRAGLRLTGADLRPDWPVIRQVLHVGIPAGVSMCSNSLGFLVLQGMIGSLGKVVMGAFTIGSRMTEVLSVPAGALAASTAPVVGQALGAGKPAVARRAVHTSVALFAFGLLAPQALLMVFGHHVARAFTDDPDIIRETWRFFLIVPASNYFFNIMMVLMSAFYGSGHTRPAMIIHLLRQWVLRIPICMLLGFALGWASWGVYAGLAIGNLIGAGMAWWVFALGKWETPIVPPRAVPVVPVADTAEPAPGLSAERRL